MSTLRQARAAFFARAGFDESGYDDNWVHLRLGPVPVLFPNTPARKRAVPLHDLHHTLTGYDTSWRGEFAISAWEIGSGCGTYAAAWMLDLTGMAVGAVLYPKSTFHAFVRGARSRNFYRDAFVDGSWRKHLDDDVDALRRALPVDEGRAPAKPGEVARYAAWTALGLVLAVAPVAACVAALVAVVALAAR